ASPGRLHDASCNAPRRIIPLAREGDGASLDLRGLAQCFGAVGRFPRKRGGGLRLLLKLAAFALFPLVGVLERLAAEVAIRSGGLVDRMDQVQHLDDAVRTQ